MKFFNYLLTAALCAGAFASCQTPDGNTATDESKNITVSIAGLTTTRSVDQIGDKTIPDVDNILIFVTEADGVILRSIEVASTSIDDWGDLTGDGLTIPNVGASAAKLKIYGNYMGVVSPVTGVVAATFQNQQGAKVLCSGKADFSAANPTVEGDDGTTVYTYDVTVDIAPVVARMQIKSVTFQETGTGVKVGESGDPDNPVTLSWTGFTGELIGVYFNNFYTTFDGTDEGGLKNNTTYVDKVKDGKWLFGGEDLKSAYYNNWNVSGYQPMVALDAGKCYAFNFFPETGVIPHLFFNVNVEGDDFTLSPADAYDVMNVDLIKTWHWVLVKSYLHNGTPYTGFEPGNLYDLDIVIQPQYVQADLSPVKYNIVLKVTISEWRMQALDPVFEQQ